MDSLGDRMKMYESAETNRKLMPLLPVYIRLDGRSFSKFTRSMQKPYDIRMCSVMVATTEYLINETNACIGYTQSDEISLVLYSDKVSSQMFFNGKIFKLVSSLASMASASFFYNYIKEFEIYPSDMKMLPTFDCRVLNLPNKTEAANMLLWREKDATKNAITSAVRYAAKYSHKAIKGKNSSEKQEMMHEKGINFNDYPDFFKRGTFLKRILVDKELSDESWNRIPVQHRPESRIVQRHEVVTIKMPIFSKVLNREGVIFGNEEPEERLFPETD